MFQKIFQEFILFFFATKNLINILFNTKKLQFKHRYKSHTFNTHIQCTHTLSLTHKILRIFYLKILKLQKYKENFKFKILLNSKPEAGSEFCN